MTKEYVGERMESFPGDSPPTFEGKSEEVFSASAEEPVDLSTGQGHGLQRNLQARHLTMISLGKKANRHTQTNKNNADLPRCATNNNKQSLTFERFFSFFSLQAEPSERVSFWPLVRVLLRVDRVSLRSPIV